MLCSVCLKNEVTSDLDYCLDCYFSGRRFEMFLLSEERSNLLGRIREIEGVSTAAVWHVGNGRFNLGVLLNDGTIVSPGIAMEMEDMLTVVPAVPPLDTPWGIMVARATGDGTMISAMIIQETFDDDGVVEEVQKIVNGEREFTVALEDEDVDVNELLTEAVVEQVLEAVEQVLDTTWITGVGQFVGNTHSPEQCEGEGCVVHHPSDHPMKEWPTKFVGDSMVVVPKHSERLCEHGIGHPDPDDIAFFGKQGVNIVIGHRSECDGCCSADS